MNLVIHLFCFFFFTLHWHRLHIKSRAKKRIIIIIIKKLVFKISKILKSQCFPPNLLNKKLLFIVEWQFYFWDRSQRRLELLVFSWDAIERQRGRRNRDAKGGGGSPNANRVGVLRHHKRKRPQPYQEDSKTRPRNKWNDSSTRVGSVPTPTTRHLDSPKILYPLIGMIDREIDRYTEIWKACKLVSLVDSWLRKRGLIFN